MTEETKNPVELDWLVYVKAEVCLGSKLLNLLSFILSMIVVSFEFYLLNTFKQPGPGGTQ